MMFLALALLSQPSEVCIEVVAKTSSVVESRLASLEAAVAALQTAPQPEPEQVSLPWLTATDFFDPDQGETLADAIEKIQADHCEKPEGAAQVRDSCWVMIPPGAYDLAGDTITLTKGVRLTGSNPSGGWACNTQIRSDLATAIHVAPGGAWSSIENICLHGDLPLWTESSSTTWQPLATAGIHMENRALVRDVWVRGFAQGIRISADVNRTGGTTPEGFVASANTNANLFRLDNVRVDNARHKGIHIDGGDTNAGTAIGVGSSSNCLDGDKFEAAGWEPCANIDESSFLGNTWVGIHSSFAVDRRGNRHEQIVSSGNASSRNVFVGTYAESESGNGLSRHSASDIVLGGIAGWRGGGAGMVIKDGRINTACFRNDNATQNPLGAELCLGRASGDIAMVQSSSHAPMRLKTDGPDHWRIDISNLNAKRVLQIDENDASVQFPNTDFGGGGSVDLSPYALRTELPTWEEWSRIPQCASVAPMIVRTSTHGHVTSYQDSGGFVRTCYFEPVVTSTTSTVTE